MVDSLTSVLTLNKKNLKRDLTRFLHMDPLFHSKKLSFNGQDIMLDCLIDDVGSQSPFEITIGANITFPNHSQKRLPLIKTQITDDGKLTYSMLQELGLDGSGVKKEDSLSADVPKEYAFVRNSLIEKLHSLMGEYNDSPKIISKVL